MLMRKSNRSTVFLERMLRCYRFYGSVLLSQNRTSEAIDAFVYGDVGKAVDILKDMVQGETGTVEQVEYVIHKTPSLLNLVKKHEYIGRLTTALATAYLIRGDLDTAVLLAEPWIPKDTARWAREYKK